MEAARSMSRPSSRVRLLPTHRISSGRARTCGTGLERPFRHTPESGTACSIAAMRPPRVHSGVPAFSGTQ